MPDKLGELVLARAAICNDPANAAPPGGLWKYTQAARRKLDKLDREIAYELRLKRLARGETINDEGYSGRQTNKR